MVILLKLLKRLDYPFSIIARRKFMFAITLGLFAGFMGIFVPILVSVYFQWIKETDTPALFRTHPYLPMWGSLVGIVLISALFIYASIREYRIQKRKKQEESNIKERLDMLEKLHR
jgi:uncharacterized membrane protein